MKKTPLAIIGITLVTGIAGTYYYLDNKNPKSPRHGAGVMDLSCSNSVIFSLRLKQDGTTLWTKTHDELFSMPGAVPTQDRRFQGRNIMPLAALFKHQDNITAIEVIPCDGKTVLLRPGEILQHPERYYLGQNRKNRMKLLTYQGDRQYQTKLRNVIDINLINSTTMD